ncbi:MAG: ABC transporter permease [Bacteroidota bacterium]
MRWSIINTIYKKELTEVLRDKRTVYLVILLPFFLYPVMFAVIGLLSSSQMEKINQESVKILVNEDVKTSPLYAILQQDSTLSVEEGAFDPNGLDSTKNTIGLEIQDIQRDSNDQAQAFNVNIYYNSTKDVTESRANRINQQIEALNQQLLAQRLEERNLQSDFLTPIRVNKVDLAPPAAQMGKLIGRFLPMILLFFIFTGMIYIAIDITAGEKERQTLQTLFVSPIKVPEIITGKFLAVFTVGVVSAVMNLLSLILAFFIQVKLMGGGDGLSSMSLSVSSQGAFWLVLLILLSTVFIGGITLAVVVLANSYKESQSYVTPLMMLLLLPAIFATQPGVELTAQTALIPIVNIFLAMGEIFIGDFDPKLMALVSAMALIYAIIALVLASIIFANENVVTGQKVSMKSLFSRS